MIMITNTGTSMTKRPSDRATDHTRNARDRGDTPRLARSVFFDIRPFVIRAFFFALTVGLVFAPTTFAHDTGFAHSDRTLYVRAIDGGFLLIYRIQLEADEALAELARMDADEDGRVSDAEREAHFASRSRAIAAHLKCVPDSEGEAAPIAPAPAGYALDHPLTQLYAFVIETDAVALTLTDTNFTHKAGRLRITHGEDVTITVLDEDTQLLHAETVRLRMARNG